MATPRLRLGQLLVDAKMITEQALQEVLDLQRADGRRLGTLLVESGRINETQLTQILSHQLSVPWVSLLHIEFSRQLLNLVPHDIADSYCLVPIYVRNVRHQGDTLYVAMEDPTNEDGLRACRDHAGLPVRAMIAPPQDIRNAIRVYYGAPARAASLPAPPPPAPRVAQASAPAAAAPRPQSKALPPTPAPSARAVEAAAAVESSPRTSSALEARINAMLETGREVVDDTPVIEASEIPQQEGRSPAERLRSLIEPSGPPPSSRRDVESSPSGRGRAPRMVALTLLDGTTIKLPAKSKSPDRARSDTERAALPSEPPPSDRGEALTAHDLVVALRVVAQGADASEVLGTNVRWEAMFAALLSLLLKKHLIADWEFVEELKKLT